MTKSASVPQHVVHMEDAIHSRRPPSPLSHYDYGSISMKPKSTVAQHRHRAGETLRAKHRSSSAGFYFPGVHSKQGGYGFSLLDPVLLSPKPWEKHKVPELRHNSDPTDVRPLHAEEHSLRRARKDNPVTSPSVRSTAGHTCRATRLAHCADNLRESKVHEQAKFEHGFFEGSWRDPLLDMAQIPEAAPEQHSEWLCLADEDMTDVQRLAANLLFNLEGVAYKYSSTVAQLFSAHNGVNRGVVELEMFQKALVKLGIFAHGELTTENAIAVMSIIDPSFDGKVSVPTLDRAVRAARRIRVHREEAENERRKRRQVKLSHSYSDPIPVEVVRVEYPASSLLNFNRSFQKFMSQQRVLLDHHNEAVPVGQ